MKSGNGDKLARLVAIGFVEAGKWARDGEKLRFICQQHEDARNVLYAFVVEGEPVYVGKTVRPLYQRMQGYRTPGATQWTNLRNRDCIVKQLASNHDVFVYVLPDNGLMHYGGFHINLAAGLEDSIIRELDPVWNGGHKELSESPTEAEPTD